MYIYFCWMDKTDERLISDSSRQLRPGRRRGMFVHYCLYFMSLPLNSECFLCFVFILVIGSFPSTSASLSKVSLYWLKVHTCVPPAAWTQVFGAGGKMAFSMRCFQSWHSSWTAQSSTLIHHPSCQPPTESAFSHPGIFGGSHNKSAPFSTKEALSRSPLAAVSNSDSLVFFFYEEILNVHILSY